RAELDFAGAEVLCRRLIGVDEYNEEIYRELIDIYSQQGKYGKCTEVYNELSELLSQELSILPDEKTAEAYEKALSERNSSAAVGRLQDNSFMFGRERELKLLSEKLLDLTKRKRVASVVVTGEAGIGKSMLMREAVRYADSGKLHIINTICYKAEEGYALKPWNAVFEELGKLIREKAIILPANLVRIVGCIFPTFSNQCTDIYDFSNLGILQYQVAEKAIVDIIRKVSEKISLVICFDDIQWMDDMSLSLLRNCIYQNFSGSFLGIMTCRNEYSKKIENQINELLANGFLEKIHLERFDEAETREFSRRYLPKYSFSEALDATIMKETEGNPFFLVEFLNGLKEGNIKYQLTAKMKDIISGRIMNVSEEGRKILNIASLFFDRITFEDLQEISGKSEDELSDLLEELQERCLIKEFADGADVWFCFTHQKLMEYTYYSISASKRKILHNRIAGQIEKKLENCKTDTLLYSKLIHHYENAGNRLMALKYRLKELNEYIHVSHELFPILERGDIQDKKCFYLTKEYTAKCMQEIKKMFDVVRGSAEGDKSELQQYEMQFMYIEGRNAIRLGEYSLGLEKINEMIRRARQLGEYQFALQGYRSIIYYGINTFRLDEMSKNLIFAKEISNKYSDSENLLLLERLEGVLEIMRGNLEAGEALMNKVISTLEQLPNQERYILIVAGSYSYLGEIRKKQKRYREALEYYEKGIELCKQSSLANIATIFYANGTQVAYHMKDRELAMDYFEHAVKVYRQYDYPWGKTSAFGYAALCRLEGGRYEECLELTRTADENAQSMKNPVDLGVVCLVKARMAYEASQNTRAATAFRHYAGTDAEYYCRKGLDIMEGIALSNEREAILELLKELG
ncbi:MAG: AAA family ATPase, partial [Pseudomonadota bacterium]